MMVYYRPAVDYGCLLKCNIAGTGTKCLVLSPYVHYIGPTCIIDIDLPLLVDECWRRFAHNVIPLCFINFRLYITVIICSNVNKYSRLKKILPAESL